MRTITVGFKNHTYTYALISFHAKRFITVLMEKKKNNFMGYLLAWKVLLEGIFRKISGGISLCLLSLLHL